MEPHTHRNAFSEHLLEYCTVEKRKLLLSLAITSVVMVIEFIGGVLTNSIALISDAGHMFTHAFAMSVSLVAIQIARKPPCHHRTFGLYRAEILAAFINGLFLLLVVAVIVYEAVLRILHPREVQSLQMLVIALVGLAVNGASIVILRGSEANINVRSVFYHLLGDAASSVGIVAGAVVIYYTAWNIVDPLVSLGISGLILYWAWGVLNESARVLLEMAPKGLNIEMIGDDLKATFPDIDALYNVHLWAITPEMVVFSAHVKVPRSTLAADRERLQSRLAAYLVEHYNIVETTIQLSAEEEPGNL